MEVELINIVSFGGGTNSAAMLVGLHQHGIPVDLILFADTGAEQPHTYCFIETMNEWLAVHNMPSIITVENVDRFGNRLSLETECLRSQTLPSIAYGYKRCSQKHKIAPQGKFCNNYPPCRAVWASGERVTRFLGYDAGEIRRYNHSKTYDAKDKKYHNRYHATVGAVNKGTVTEEHEYIQDGQDRSRIFAVIVNWNSRHATVAGMGSPTGVWDPAKTAETAEGPVIAYGSLLIGETTPGDAMTTVEIPIEYYDRTTKPTGAYTLVISCTTSAYGDFKVGCLGNVMYVDDFEWVY